MASLTEKRFQYISWEIEADGKDVNLHSKIYNDIKKLIKDIKNENIVIAIGLNPSNTTVFNDDETNLYLRDKIKVKFECEGYILTNIFPTIDPNSNNISLNDTDPNHITDLIKLLDNFEENKIVLFFGQKGVDLLNSKNNDLQNLKNKFLNIGKNRTNKVYYTASIPTFKHPSRLKQNYTLEPFDANILEKIKEEK